MQMYIIDCGSDVVCPGCGLEQEEWIKCLWVVYEEGREKEKEGDGDREGVREREEREQGREREREK